MIVSEKVKLVSMFAFILIWIYGMPLVNLFQPSTVGRILSLLFVTIVGSVSTYIFIFAKTEEKVSR